MLKHIKRRQSSAFDLGFDLVFDLAFELDLTLLLTRIRMWRCQLCGAENGSEVKLFERSEFASFPILRAA
jgi:hypothetical protein